MIMESINVKTDITVSIDDRGLKHPIYSIYSVRCETKSTIYYQIVLRANMTPQDQWVTNEREYHSKQMLILLYRLILDFYEELLSKSGYHELARTLIMEITPSLPDHDVMEEERDYHLLLRIARAALDRAEFRLRNRRTES
ncbi:hypothetical protein ZTR_10979 [Talaromyces verruculosus]|nr:hypothetical protein ZTR_10979 [Talaromyces verruculosus]